MLSAGGRYTLCMNDPSLSAMAAGQGIRVIHRESGDAPEDEPLRQDPAAFVQKRAEHAPGAAYIHLLNEIDPSPDEQRWTREALKYVHSIKRHAVVGNYATHRSREQWEFARPLLAEAAGAGDAIGFHLYVPDADAAGGLEWRPTQLAVGGRWFCTEFAFGRYAAGGQIDPHRGWRGITSPAQRRAFIEKWTAFFAAMGIALLYYCYDFWDKPTLEIAKAEGFGYNDLPDVIDAFRDFSTIYPLKDVSMATYPPGTNPAQKRINHTAGLKLRDNPTLSGAILAVMPYREEVTVYADPVVKVDGYFWQRVKWGSREGWAANAVNGVASFVDPVAQKFTMIRPVACDNITNHPFNEPRDYDGDGIKDDKHEGIDIVPSHTGCRPLVLAGADGVVIKVSGSGDYGNHVIVEHNVGGDVFRTWYCHLEVVLVKVGDTVKSGAYLGIMGSTGNSTGLHLHFNLQWLGKGLPGYVIADAVDPTPYFAQASVALAA